LKEYANGCDSTVVAAVVVVTATTLNAAAQLFSIPQWSQWGLTGSASR